MTYCEFAEKYNTPELNEQQIEAVTTVNGPVECLAVPGSGKTTILVTRLGYMIHACGFDPKSILTVTYTVAATHDMAARFAQYFGEELSSQLEFRTINGICAKIISWFCYRTGKTSLRLITDERQLSAIVASVWREVNGTFATESDIKAVRTAITYAKNMMLTDREIKKLDRDVDGFSQIYKVYFRYMRDNGLMDYDDQMVYTYNILKSFPEVLSRFQSLYRNICVDEAQDTSKIQHEILRLLYTDTIFFVGDEDQSIYGFRAAWPQALLQFEDRYPGAKILFMEKNYRSSAEIVKAADNFIRHNQLRHQKTMTAARTASGKAVTTRNLSSRKSQYTYLCNVASKCDEETAILYRDTESVIPLVDMLESRKIPYTMRTKDAVFFTSKAVQDITALLRLVADGKDVEAFSQVYYKIGLYLNKAAAERIIDRAKLANMNVFDAALLEPGLQQYVHKLILEKKAVFQKLKTARPVIALNEIIYGLGYVDYMEKNGIPTNKVGILSAIADHMLTVQGFLERLDELNEIMRTKEADPKASVILSTIHSAKGLQYKNVYILDAADGIFPEKVPGKKAKREEIEEYEEERRIFYVGITRAIDTLTLLRFSRESRFIDDLSAASSPFLVKKKRA